MKLPGAVKRYALIVVVGALLLAGTIAITTRKGATTLDTALFQFILFALGVGVSFYLGQRSVKQAANDVVQPLARAALRRLVSLGRGIAAVQEVAELSREQIPDLATEHGEAHRAFGMITMMLEAPLEAVGAAIDDWREFAPDLVDELRTDPEKAR